MGHAWLDSLSEDWVSQPGSADASFTEPTTPATSAPRLRDPKQKIKAAASRIPRLSPRVKKPRLSIDANSSNILNERSANEKLTPTAARRTPSKLQQQLVASSSGGRDCHACRSASTATPESIVRRAYLHRKSLSASPCRGKGDTPEWKRRLVYNELSYGEQRDLFTSAGTGLENIFKPPLPAPEAAMDDKTSHQKKRPQFDDTLPSSPPPYPHNHENDHDPSTAEVYVDDSMQEPSQQLPRRAPTSMRYRRTEESANASMDSRSSMPPKDTGSRETATAEQSALSVGLAGESRKASGRSDLRYEDFSPILLERRQASNGKTIFGPAELPPDELRKRLERLQQNQRFLMGDTDEESMGGVSESHAKSRSLDTTKARERLGAFVNFQRGGRSDEGSFRNHALSSALNDTSELHPEESLQASTPKQFPTVRVERWDSYEETTTPARSPELPPVPNPSPEKRPVSSQNSTGSPLKLFQPYDTFTNQTLLRRMSQFEEELGDLSFSIAQEDGYDDRRQSAHLPRHRQPSAPANRFGAGELDGYEFNDEFSQSYDVSGLDGDKENRGPDGDSMQPSLPPIFELSYSSSLSEAEDLVVRRRRQKSVTSRSSRRPGRDIRASFPPTIGPGRRDTNGSEIKRPRTSPSKDPTPKRRRTLNRPDDDLLPAVDSIKSSHQELQSVLGGKRQDMRSSGQQELRPRTPTPSQRSSVQRDRPPLAEIEKTPSRSSRHSQAATALPVGASLDTNRKPSIRTEDFINEANKIMAMIRSKAGLPSGLASLEESDAEHGQPSPDLESSFQESTQEPFSRPPSREGRPPLRRQSTKQEDPELVERLKKYEEASDMGDIISSSVRSAAPPQEDIPVVGEQDVSRSAWGSNGSQTSLSDAEVISDPPNIRISRNPDWEEREFASGHNDSARSQGSTGLPTQSSGMSVPTGSSRGSSRGSEARKTIAPESVSHLIPDQVGSMVLDRQRNMWVKKKSLAKKSRESFVHSEASDDPFADIPDLSVDLTLEMQNLKLGTAKKEPSAQENLPRSASPASPSRPRSAASAQKLGPVAEATEQTIRSQHRNHNNLTQRPQTAPARSEEELVEHEIGINDGRVKDRRRLTISFSSPIASVIQDVAENGGVTAGDANLTGQAHEDQVADSSRRGRRIVSVHTESRSKSRGPLRHLSVRGHSLVARPVSRIDERDEEASPGQSSQEGVSGMELSIVGDLSVVGPDADAGQQASVSWMLATPARGRDCPAVDMDGAPIIGQYVGMLSLSPLSDFTVHRADESLPLEVSYVHDGHHLVTGNRSKDRSKRVMSLSIRELVEKLAEVEPFEPYWEDMQELDLRGKGLGALHTLDEFCGQLVSLDVSRNNIRNLGGVPASVRHLKATDNQLSSLTAWNHLMNLQYIDVSNNGIGSLAPFKNLVHLRSLKADNNRITSLDGIKFHRGLQILRVRGNLIETLDLDGATMDQLTELDLKDNRIQHVANLAQLTALNSLNLEGNQLETFSVEQPMSSLRYLHLNDNKLLSLDLKSLPHLRLLHADRNRLVRIAGFSRARKIDSLSLREQRGDAPLDLPHLLSRAYEVRKLYLSGNLLSSAGFDPPTDLLNLQLLEMANCGLTGLPDHVGLAMPNLRVLNLNMNALHVQDLTPLRCVPRLKRVSLAGNRLAEAAGLVEIFAGWRYLREVDVRDNPVTQGFYAPPTIMRVVVPRAGKNNAEGEGQLDRDGDGIGGDAGGDGFALPDQDPDRDAGYCGRLDMHTRMRRRLWEAMVGARCGRVRKLDGLPLSLSLVQQQKGNGQDGSAGELEQAAEGLVGADKEDPVWLALKEKGLLLPPAPTGTSTNPAREGDGEVAVAVAANSSARWPAEDSFA